VIWRRFSEIGRYEHHSLWQTNNVSALKFKLQSIMY